MENLIRMGIRVQSAKLGSFRPPKLHSFTAFMPVFRAIRNVRGKKIFIIYFIHRHWFSVGGSQLQTPGIKTVQGVIEEALQSVFRLPGERPIRVFCGSRTDSGVHALKATVHMRLPTFRGRYLKPEFLKILLNNYLSGSENVRVVEAYSFNEFFMPRSAFLHKVYMFRVGILKKEFYCKSHVLPIMETDRTHLVCKNKDFDISKASEAASLFVGQNDFAAVSGKPSLSLVHTICNVMSFEVEEGQPSVPFDPLTERYNFYNFICKGDRFLYLMVRKMVTLALSAGYNEIPQKYIEDLLRNPMPSRWPKTCIRLVSGCGLYLVDTVYDMEKLKLESSKVEEEEDQINSQILVS